MATRLRILDQETQPATPDESARAAMAKLRVGLVNMPFVSSKRPCIQVGLLQAILARYGIRATGHHFNLALAAKIGVDAYEELCTRGTVLQIGDWVFSGAAFGDDAHPTSRYMADLGAELERITGHLGVDIPRLRDELAPAFVEECLSQVAWGDYDVVGFTSVYQQNCAALALARRIKERYPHVVIVFGGTNFEDDMGVEFMRTMPWIDFAVIGEGDATFPALLQRIALGERSVEMAGIASRRGAADRLGSASAGEVVFPGRAPLVEDLDALPLPDYDDFFAAAAALELPTTGPGQEITLSFESARGCWWGAKHHCTFCGMNKTRMSFRSKSPGRLLTEFDGQSSRYGIYSLGSTDNILDWAYIKEVFGPLYDQRKDYRICVDLKSNCTAEQLRLLARGGVRSAQVGIESLSTHVLDLMDKGVTAIQNVCYLKWAYYYGISSAWHVLRGFPGERIEDYEVQLGTMRLISHLQPPAPRSLPIRIDKFSPNYDRAKQLGFENVRPCTSYAHIYPEGVALDKIACFHDCDIPSALPGWVYDAQDEQLRWWYDAWHGKRRPKLVYHRGPDQIRITDTRARSGTRVEMLKGNAVLLYEACSLTHRTAEGARDRVEADRGVVIGIDQVKRTLDDLTRRGLMMREDGRYLSLALPANRHW